VNESKWSEEERRNAYNELDAFDSVLWLIPPLHSARLARHLTEERCRVNALRIELRKLKGFITPRDPRAFEFIDSVLAKTAPEVKE
jgi:hypothetical protein